MIRKSHNTHKNKDYYKLKDNLDKLANINTRTEHMEPVDSLHSINKDLNNLKRKNNFTKESDMGFVDYQSRDNIHKNRNKRNNSTPRANEVKQYKAKVKFTEEKINRKLKRAKRETFPAGATVFVETAVFVDRDLFEHMKTNFPADTEREIIRFVLAMINAVSTISFVYEF